MKFKVIYHVGKKIQNDTKLMSGKLSINQEKINISGAAPLEVELSTCKTIELFRLHGIGNMIEISCPEKRIFVTIPRLYIAGLFIKIHTIKTAKLYKKLKKCRDHYKKQSKAINTDGLSNWCNLLNN